MKKISANFESDFRAAYLGGVIPSNTDYLESYKEGYEKTCYQVYCNAYDSALKFLVIGRIVKDGVPPIGLSELEEKNFLFTNEQRTGSILRVEDKKWTVMINDSWVIGGINALLPFYVASPRQRQNIYHDTYQFTVTGRELIGLTHFGYQPISHPQLGEVFVCKDAKRAQGATLTEYERRYCGLREEVKKRNLSNSDNLLVSPEYK
ncbi:MULTISPECIES: hypothetical protein [unclassified Microcoleus]|uniref:hypothetical protein n=1 Tax=unclassified Microcoleus TaxID=2642155 RepID=UPI002FD717AE